VILIAHLYSSIAFVVISNRKLLVMDPKDQRTLQQIGGTFDCQFLAFGHLFALLTVYSVHVRKTTLGNLTDGSMASFAVSMAEVVVSGREAKRQVFLIDSMTEVLCGTVGLFVKDSLESIHAGCHQPAFSPIRLSQPKTESKASRSRSHSKDAESC